MESTDVVTHWLSNESKNLDEQSKNYSRKSILNWKYIRKSCNWIGKKF